MGLDRDVLKFAIGRLASAARDHEVDLNAADGKLGDGDTGLMLRRLFERLNQLQYPEDGDLSAAFQALAKAAAGATGSSLGTLIVVALMTLAAQTKGRVELGWGEIGGLLAKICDAMIVRGGASLGDKTIIDSLDAVSRAIAGLTALAEIRVAAREAAASTLEIYRMRPNKVGRARMFGERSIGLDDPGMFAFLKMVEALTKDVGSNFEKLKCFPGLPPIIG